LEDRVARSAERLEEAKADLSKRVSERRRLSESGTVHQTQLSEMDQRVRDGVSALAKAAADLEKERRKLEGTALHSRHSSLDAARVGRAFVNSFRSELRAPTDSLMQSIRRLLESSLQTDQKRLVETALESALRLQAKLQEEAHEGTPAV